MTGITDVIASIDDAAALSLLQALIAIPTPSGREQAAADMLDRYLRESGFQDVRHDPAGNVLVTLTGTERGSTRAFVTHFDSAGAGEMADPYVPQILDGAPFGKAGKVVRGLGASAPKAAVAAMVEALRALVRSRMPIRGTVRLVIVTKDLLADHAGPREVLTSFPFEADWMLAGEPSGNKLVLGARGIHHYRITIWGKAAHNGRPHEAANPLYPLAEVLAGLARLELPTHAALGSATLSPFEVGSEATPPLSPHRAHVLVDRRTVPGERTADVRSSIERFVAGVVARHAGTSASLELVRAMHSFETPPTSSLVAELQGSVRAALGRELETTYISFSSNAGYGISERGWRAVGLGPGHITDVGKDEHVEVAQVEEATRIYAALMAGG